MKFFIALATTALLSFAACLFLPWWSIAIAAFVVAVAVPQKSVKAFASGFIALFVLWGVMSFLISTSNQHLMAHKMSLLILKIDSPVALICATAVIGALVAGLAALSGSFVRQPKQ
jgi:hypothetical protein